MKRLYLKALAAVILGCIQSISALGCAWLLKTIVDIVTGVNIAFSLKQFYILAFVYYGFYMLFYYVGKKIYVRTVCDFRVYLREKLLNGLLWVKESAYAKRTLGTVLSMFQYQVDLMEEACFDSLSALIKDTAAILVSLGAVFLMQWQIAAGSILLLAIYLLVTRNIRKRLEVLQTSVVSAKAEENNELVTMVKGYFTAKDCGGERFFLNRYVAGVTQSAEKSFQCNYFYDLLSIVSSNLETLVTLLIIIFGGIMVQKGITGITIGGLLAIIQIMAAVIGPIGTIGTRITQIKSTAGTRRGLKEFIKDGMEEKKEWFAAGEALPELSTLSLQNVSFSYEGKTVLNQVSYKFQAGRKYAIVGESGSGKTTLLRLLLKQLNPELGNICWNGISYSQIQKNTLLSRIGYAAQEPMVFDKTLRENIMGRASEFSKPVYQEKLHEVLVRSGLGQLRDCLTEGEMLDLRARELSGGEQKRMAYARALYKNSDILILDEITSALDGETAQSIENDLLNTEKRLVLHVTHCLKPYFVPLYDDILTIRNGKIVSLKMENRV